jgi:hypothetical protein
LVDWHIHNRRGKQHGAFHAFCRWDGNHYREIYPRSHSIGIGNDNGHRPSSCDHIGHGFSLAFVDHDSADDDMHGDSSGHRNVQLWRDVECDGRDDHLRRGTNSKRCWNRDMHRQFGTGCIHQHIGVGDDHGNDSPSHSHVDNGCMLSDIDHDRADGSMYPDR